ncbi:hypothetical protein VTN00DRAFT_8808 [Thermoascus crustaceus]|uniref:uncharacterized protein n=1 Tax=Thermoascus crustaceus TaxID=5088 RepID=UPI003742E492
MLKRSFGSSLALYVLAEFYLHRAVSEAVEDRQCCPVYTSASASLDAAFFLDLLWFLAPTMSAPPIVKATLQAALINAGSNVLAQGIKAYRDQRPFELDVQTLLQFTTCAVIISPLTFLWLENLEATFPGFSDTKSKPKPKTEKEDESDEKKEKDEEKPRLNVRNTALKVVIDQTIGAAWNTVLFLTTMGILRGQDYDTVVEAIQKDFWPIMIAGFKMWPFVSILCFTVVPANRRLLVSSLFGVLWAIYLSLMSN